MLLKTTLDTEKEKLVAFIWLLPLIPLLAIFVLFLCYGNFLWVLLLIAFGWTILWSCIYRNIRTEICFDGKKITLLLKQKIYCISVEDVLYIEETMFLGTPHKLYVYKIYLRPNVSNPAAYLLVRNRKIQENVDILFPGVQIKKNVVLS